MEELFYIFNEFFVGLEHVVGGIWCWVWLQKRVLEKIGWNRVGALKG